MPNLDQFDDPYAQRIKRMTKTEKVEIKGGHGTGEESIFEVGEIERMKPEDYYLLEDPDNYEDQREHKDDSPSTSKGPGDNWWEGKEGRDEPPF